MAVAIAMRPEEPVKILASVLLLVTAAS